jgi:hypothetical protein
MILLDSCLPPVSAVPAWLVCQRQPRAAGFALSDHDGSSCVRDGLGSALACRGGRRSGSAAVRVERVTRFG